MSEDNNKKENKETIRDRHDKIQSAILMQINNLLMDIGDELDENQNRIDENQNRIDKNQNETNDILRELKKELSHKTDIPGYYKEDEELQKVRQATGFDKEEDNFYDISDTITTALASDPGDPDDPNYNRERIYEVLSRYANPVCVANDGTDDLFVRIGHHGTTTFSKEARIIPGDVKTYWRVYELRLRSPTKGLPYRVSEYKLCCNGGFVSSNDTLQILKQLAQNAIFKTRLDSSWYLYVDIGSALPSGTNTLGSVNINQRLLALPYTDTTTVLAANAVYTGTARDTQISSSSPYPHFGIFQIFSYSDQVGTLFVQESPDNVTWVTIMRIDTSPIVDTDGATTRNVAIHTHYATLRYVRVAYRNGAVLQTVFRLSSRVVGNN